MSYEFMQPMLRSRVSESLWLKLGFNEIRDSGGWSLLKLKLENLPGDPQMWGAAHTSGNPQLWEAAFTSGNPQLWEAANFVVLRKKGHSLITEDKHKILYTYTNTFNIYVHIYDIWLNLHKIAGIGAQQNFRITHLIEYSMMSPRLGMADICSHGRFISWWEKNSLTGYTLAP